MALKHTISDSKIQFVVDPVTRAIINKSSGKTELMQYDHNSERFTFEVPRYIENHDMSQCDVIQVHYTNTNTATSVSLRKTYRGVHTVDDVKLESEDSEIITFSWLVPETATMFAGSLKFQLKFICHDDEDEEVDGYKWHTKINDDMTITAGLAYSEEEMDPATTATLQSLEIIEIEGGLDIILDGVHHYLYNGNGAVVIPDTVERTTNKVVAISESSTDKQYPTALAVWNAIKQYASTNDSSDQLPNPGTGDNGKVIEVSNGGYVLKFPNASSFMNYLKTITVTAIDENSTDSQYVSAKAVYDLVTSKLNTAVTEALNTEVEV